MISRITKTCSNPVIGDIFLFWNFRGGLGHPFSTCVMVLGAPKARIISTNHSSTKCISSMLKKQKVTRKSYLQRQYIIFKRGILVHQQSPFGASLLYTFFFSFGQHFQNQHLQDLLWNAFHPVSWCMVYPEKPPLNVSFSIIVMAVCVEDLKPQVVHGSHGSHHSLQKWKNLGAFENSENSGISVTFFFGEGLEINDSWGKSFLQIPQSVGCLGLLRL